MYYVYVHLYLFWDHFQYNNKRWRCLITCIYSRTRYQPDPPESSLGDTRIIEIYRSLFLAADFLNSSFLANNCLIIQEVTTKMNLFLQSLQIEKFRVVSKLRNWNNLSAFHSRQLSNVKKNNGKQFLYLTFSFSHCLWGKSMYILQNVIYSDNIWF